MLWAIWSCLEGFGCGAFQMWCFSLCRGNAVVATRVEQGTIKVGIKSICWGHGWENSRTRQSQTSKGIQRVVLHGKSTVWHKDSFNGHSEWVEDGHAVRMELVQLLSIQCVYTQEYEHWPSTNAEGRENDAWLGPRHGVLYMLQLCQSC